MEFIWALVEYASCLCEPLFACILFSHHLGCKNKRRFAAVLLVPIIALLTFLMNRQSLPWYAVSIILLAELYAYSILLFKGSISNRSILGVAPSIVFVFADHTVMSIMMLITTRWTESLIPANGLRLIGITLYVLILALTLIVLITIKRTEGELPLVFSLAPIVLAALGIISILIHEAQYEKLAESGIDVLPCAVSNIAISILCASSALLLHLASVIYKKNLDQQKELQQRKLEIDHIDQVSSMYEYVREWRHDMNGLLSTVDSLAQEQNCNEIRNVISGMTEAAKETAVIVSTGNPAVDATISSKAIMAKEASIKLNCILAVPPELKIDQADVCSILINLLDNAIYAVKQLDTIEKTIDLEVSLQGNMLKIGVKNPSTGKYVFSGKDLLSTKKNSVDHGLGLKRIKRIAEKHGGYVELHPNENSFEAIVLLAAKEGI